MMYALLIQDSHDESTPRPEGELDTLMIGHRALQEEAIGAGELVATSRLAPPTAARTLRRKGDSFQVADGPYMETKEWLVGLYLVECETEAQAVKRAEQICPPNGSIEIRPVVWQQLP